MSPVCLIERLYPLEDVAVLMWQSWEMQKGDKGRFALNFEEPYGYKRALARGIELVDISKMRRFKVS